MLFQPLGPVPSGEALESIKQSRAFEFFPVPGGPQAGEAGSVQSGRRCGTGRCQCCGALKPALGGKEAGPRSGSGKASWRRGMKCDLQGKRGKTCSRVHHVIGKR